MGAVRSVCAVETQGEEEFDEWTTSFKLQFSVDGVTWNAYKENNVEKVRESLSFMRIVQGIPLGSKG